MYMWGCSICVKVLEVLQVCECAGGVLKNFKCSQLRQTSVVVVRKVGQFEKREIIRLIKCKREWRGSINTCLLSHIRCEGRGCAGA